MVSQKSVSLDLKLATGGQPTQGFKESEQPTLKLRIPLAVPVAANANVVEEVPIQTMAAQTVLPAEAKDCNEKFGMLFFTKPAVLVSLKVPTLYGCPIVIVMPVLVPL